MFFSRDDFHGFIHTLLERVPWLFILLSVNFHLRDSITCGQITGTTNVTVKPVSPLLLLPIGDIYLNKSQN